MSDDPSQYKVNETDFSQIISQIQFKQTFSTGGASGDDFTDDALFNSLAAYGFNNLTASNPLPSSWSAFAAAATPTISPPMTSDQLEEQFLTEYRSMLGLPKEALSSTATTIGGDWSPALDSLIASPNSPDTFNASIKAQFENSFGQFLSNVNYGTGLFTVADFLTQWRTGMTRTASISTGVPSDVAGVPLASYQSVYAAFFGSTDTAGFNKAIAQFAANTVSSQGFFNPSQSFSNWVNTVQAAYSSQNTGTAFPATSVETSSSSKVLILNQIFALIVQLTQMLQGTAAAQSNRLVFLTKWQQAYTDLINQVPTFTKAQVDDDNTRSDLNNRMSQYSQQLQGWRQSVSDAAKSLQSGVNQSTDAVSQQTDLATSILQQLQGILASIFK